MDEPHRHLDKIEKTSTELVMETNKNQNQIIFINE